VQSFCRFIPKRTQAGYHSGANTVIALATTEGLTSIMVGTKITIPLTTEELTSVGARLYARADAIDQVALQDLSRDIRLAARVCERLALVRTEISQIADKCTDQDAARELRDLLSDAEGE
jgi:hypothetical protein